MDSDSEATYFSPPECIDKTDIISTKCSPTHAKHETKLIFPIYQKNSPSLVINNTDQDSYTNDCEISPEIFSDTDKDMGMQRYNENTYDSIQLTTESTLNAEYQQRIFTTNIEKVIEEQVSKRQRSTQSNNYNVEQNFYQDTFASNDIKHTLTTFHEKAYRVESQKSLNTQFLIRQNVLSTSNVTSKRAIDSETTLCHRKRVKPRIISNVVIKQADKNVKNKTNAGSIQKVSAPEIKLNVLNKNDIGFLNRIKYIRNIDATEWSLI